MSLNTSINRIEKIDNYHTHNSPIKFTTRMQQPHGKVWFPLKKASNLLWGREWMSRFTPRKKKGFSAFLEIYYQVTADRMQRFKSLHKKLFRFIQWFWCEEHISVDEIRKFRKLWIIYLLLSVEAHWFIDYV